MPAMDGLTSHGDVYDFGGSETSSVKKPSRNMMGALSGKFMPTKYKSQVERALKMALMTAHSPFLRPFEIINLFSNHILAQFDGLVDGIYEQGYKLFPHKMIGQGLKALKNSIKFGKGNNNSKNISDHWLLKKLNIKIDDNLAEELIKNVTKIYDPEYLKSVSPEFVNEHGKLVFFTKALRHGEHPYITLSEHILEEAIGEVTKKAFGGAGQAINHLGEQVHEDGLTQEEMDVKLQKPDAKAANEVKKTKGKLKSNTDMKAKMSKAKTARDKAKVVAETGIDKSFETASNVATKAGKVANAAKNGVQSGVQKVTNGTKNLSFGNSAKEPSKQENKGIIGQITGTISGIGNSIMGLLKNLPIPGLGGGNSPNTQPV